MTTLTQAELIQRNELLDETLALYAEDETRFLEGSGEAYGSIPTEAGMVARYARQRARLRQARQVLASDDIVAAYRALDINGRLCTAFLILTGIYGQDHPWPDLSDVSLLEANAACEVVERLNREAAAFPGATIISTIASPKHRARTLAAALMAHDAAEREAVAHACRAGMLAEVEDPAHDA